MPRDLPDLLADALPRDTGAPDLGAIESRVDRRRLGRRGGAVLALAAAVAVAVQVLPLSPPAPMIDQVQDTAPAGTTVLPLPPAGEVAAAHANGRPVFVVHDDDGDVRVLDAISPHGGDPYVAKVLVHCTTSGWFVDPWHGSKFADNGAWVGGPAPYGLAEHDVVRTTADSVVVGALQSAPTRDGLEGSEPTGPGCGDTLSGVRVDDFLLHTATETALVPGLHYAEYPRDGGDSGLLVRDQPQVPLPGDDTTLPLPAPGEVNADHVNGRPVFVRNNGDGNVLVLDAVNPQVTEFGPKVLAWCRRGPQPPNAGELPAGGVAVDLWYGSRFTSQGLALGAGGVPAGGWAGGPAPTGLGRLPVRTVTPDTVTVAGSPLPPPPRVGNESLGAEGCSQAVSLFPDWSGADPTILDDLVLHEPLFDDDWWYPTPARILGAEPGLPPDELERYVDALLAERGELDLADLPALGDAGLARQSDLGVELLDLEGASLGIIPRAELVRGERRDGHGGAFLLRDSEGTHRWVAPSTGSSVPADGLTVALFERFVEQPDGTWRATTLTEDLPPLPGPLHVGNSGRLVTGPVCTDDFGDCAAPTLVDLDNGGVDTTAPGCVGTDGFADFNRLEVCNGPDGSFVRGLFVPPEGEVRYAMPRYADQPADSRTIGSIRDAVFGHGDARVVAELSLECEVPRVVGYDDGGAAFDLFGGDRWEDAPASLLLGTVAEDGVAGVLVQVLADTPCSETPTVQPGVWLVTDQHTGPLNQVHGTERLVLWTDAVGDLDFNS